jgi:biopolymer transport protein ExbD
MASASSGYSDDDQDSPIADINVTPLVDIVLVLLIVFMITMPAIVSIDLLNERELNIALPRASEARPITSRIEEVVVNVEATGRYVVRGARKSDTGLYNLFRQAAADNPGHVAVVIRADRNCPWNYVINVMNLCNRAQIREYTVTALE